MGVAARITFAHTTDYVLSVDGSRNSVQHIGSHRADSLAHTSRVDGFGVRQTHNT